MMAKWHLSGNPTPRQMAHYDLYEHFCQCGPRVVAPVHLADRRRCSRPAGPRVAPPAQYLYFTEQDIQRILDNLDGLRDLVFPQNLHVEDEDQLRLEQQFPSVCLIGLGRCGSNIALDVAELVYNARTFFLNEFNNEDRFKGEGATARRAGSARTCAWYRTRAQSRCFWSSRW